MHWNQGGEIATMASISHRSLFLLHPTPFLKPLQNQYDGMAMHQCWLQIQLDIGVIGYGNPTNTMEITES